VTKLTTGANFRLHRELLVPQPIAVVFEFFSRPENLQTITPPWLRFRIVTPQSEIRAGTLIGYRLRVHGLPFRWLTKIDRWTPPFEFVDVQLKGPYKFWRHVHSFSQVGRATRISDTVDYSLPFGALGLQIHRWQVARDLSKIFDYREQRVRSLLRE
jgi:ligand-binding SRPBCC domain-containing protein